MLNREVEKERGFDVGSMLLCKVLFRLRYCIQDGMTSTTFPRDEAKRINTTTMPLFKYAEPIPQHPLANVLMLELSNEPLSLINRVPRFNSSPCFHPSE
jgi:hypothetical protein